jgi:glucokinase
MMILAGDIGGTSTRLAFFEKGKLVGEERKFASSQYKSLEEIVQEFLQSEKVQIDKACFGIAGPVRNGVCKATNLPWIIDAARVAKTVRIRSVHLLNDLEANAYGLAALKEEELYLLNRGEKQRGNQALIAAGTGLGEAGLFWDGKTHRPFACEGGHTDFGPRDEREMELLAYLKKKFGHVSYERVISGPGLHLLFQFLVETGKEVFSPAVKAEMAKRDPSKAISDWGSKGKDAACVRAVDWFVSLYGAESGNLALKFLSLGGFYVGGGIAPHLVEKMASGGAFVSAFADKGRFRELLLSIPIWIVLNDNAALLGAASYLEGR